MAETDFTRLLVMALPMPWPPRQPVQLMDAPQGRVQVILVGHSDGHLEAAVSTALHLPISTAHFQRVSITGPNLFAFSLTHEDGQLRARINGTELLTLQASAGASFVIPERESDHSPPSYALPEALAACKSAMEERADRFATRKTYKPRTESRTKSAAEQANELGEAVRALDHLHRISLEGAPHLLPALASQLRGLIYWPRRENDRPTWNPLLFRLANAAGVPLPVYAILERSDDVFDIVEAANCRFRNLVSSCLRRYPKDELMDLETYLALPVLYVQDGSGKDREATVGDILSATANSMGSAHYDEAVPLFLDDLKSQVFLGRSLLSGVVLGLAQVTSELGQNLRSVIPEPRTR